MDDLPPASRQFQPNALAARAARQWAEPVLRSWGMDGSTPDAMLVVSELVTNAVAHGAGQVTVRLDPRPGGVRIEVVDWGGGAVVEEAPSLDRTAGRGVYIVGQVARLWGVDWPADGGKVVWAELEF